MMFLGATICKSDGTITEFTLDGEKTTNISDVLAFWDGVPDVSIFITQEIKYNDLPEGELS